jgi:hypothetical protein
VGAGDKRAGIAGTFAAAEAIRAVGASAGRLVGTLPGGIG